MRKTLSIILLLQIKLDFREVDMRIEDLTRNENEGISDLRDTFVEIANNISRNIKGHWATEEDPRALNELSVYKINSKNEKELCRFYPTLDASGQVCVSISAGGSHIMCRYEKNLISSIYDYIIKNVGINKSNMKDF